MIKRKRRYNEMNTGHERWLISYADFVTLLFAFFVVMYSVSHINQEKYQQLSTTLEALFSSQETIETTTKNTRDELSLLQKKLSEVLQQEINTGDITVQKNELWLEISLNNRIVFDSGSVELSEQASAILKDISVAFIDNEYAIQVEGFADNIAINTVRHPSNWELSSARAAAVVKLLVVYGIQPSRLAAVGYGEYQPITNNTTKQGRAQNRRISLMIGKHPRYRPIQQLQGLKEPVEATKQPLP